MLSILHKSNKLCQITQKVLKIPNRTLNLMEFQSKILLKKNGLNTQDFCIVNKANGFKDFDNFDTSTYVVKAQILAGGRGKGVFDSGFKGGVRITQDKAEAKKFVNQMLGYRLITKQTPKEGVMVNHVMVTEGVSIEKETYVCIAMDRQCNGPVMIASPEGGMNIEEVAKQTPHMVRKIPIDIYEGITDEMAGEISDFLRFKRDVRSKVIGEFKRLWEFFLKVDAIQIEINPFASIKPNNVSCIDAKLSFDDNAKFRQKEIFSIEDFGDHDPQEVEAEKHDLNYIRLNGNIGCLVNGAGLAMATMDIIKLYGGEPANFLDIGGSVTKDAIRRAFDIITSDRNVKVILVNVFGGIVNCELVANGIVHIAKDLAVPTVVRLEGTNAEQGRKIIKGASAKIEAAEDFADAAQKAVNLVKQTQ